MELQVQLKDRSKNCSKFLLRFLSPFGTILGHFWKLFWVALGHFWRLGGAYGLFRGNFGHCWSPWGHILVDLGVFLVDFESKIGAMRPPKSKL